MTVALVFCLVPGSDVLQCVWSCKFKKEHKLFKSEREQTTLQEQYQVSFVLKKKILV